MTSKLTRERLQEIAEDGFLKHGESKELARMALAALDSEPVVQPVMFIDGDISSEDADELAKVIREFNEEDERPLAKMARIIRENPHPTNECDMPKAQPAPASEPIGFRCRRNDGLGDWFHVYHRAPYEFERKHLVIENIYTTPQPAPVVPDEMLCEFYEVDSWPDLVRELVKHVEQLQDSARRNVKPWEDTFPETLLPAYIERVKQADDACRAAMLAAAPQEVPDGK
ncbi:hypothetical protein [Klebsiella pneumoniae]|uniref:hypothetical protein n=1 Tax=Klebsiella pneumoniae TaxID=573 RepID=UPI001E6294DB|nr:hypothetical protein [Klebsiella pneumoniae]